MGEVRIFIPKGASDLIETDLVRLSALIGHLKLSEEAGGFLGGPHGYGPELYENDVFMFKSFCWCDEPDCPWCAGCECPPEAYHYFVDGKEVSYEEWVEFFKREAGNAPSDHDKFAEWLKKADEINTRRFERKDPVCDFCRNGVGIDKGAEPGKNAPNFWYKPTNLKIWWYKWIGRDMEYNREVSAEEWQDIFRKCLDSIIKDCDAREQSNGENFDIDLIY